ncbi:MAG: TolC family protein [Bacteroidales bacterium]|nr:TolC family protein [Bacteroidales bacterium]
MKQMKIISFIAIFMAGSSLFAQPSLDSLLSNINKGNPILMTAQSLMEVQVLDAKTGLTPYNPEVEFAYLWGSPDELGNRTDFTVTQSFDFPTVYSSKSRLSKINQKQAELQFKATRQEILLNARQAWIMRVYLNIRKTMLTGRLAFAQTVFEGFERKLETGETNQLELNQARMKVMALENEINHLQREFSKNYADILNLTGDLEVVISDTIFPITRPIIFDSLLTSYRAGNISLLYDTEIDIKAKEVNVIFNQKLPKLKAGYYSESILGVKLQGIQAGITIPLWENARAVRTAKANLAYAETDADRYWQLKQNELQQNYEQWVYLKERVTELEELLTISNNEALLRQAMEAGEISLTEYFYESDFYFQNLLNMLEFKKEMLMLNADLKKVYY